MIKTHNGGNLPMKEVTLLDQSGYCIRLTFWGYFAQKFFHNTNTVLLLKSARIRMFMQLPNICYAADCVLKFNPDIPEAHALRQWYHNEFDGNAYNLSLDTDEEWDVKQKLKFKNILH